MPDWQLLGRLVHSFFGRHVVLARESLQVFILDIFVGFAEKLSLSAVVMLVDWALELQTLAHGIRDDAFLRISELVIRIVDHRDLLFICSQLQWTHTFELFGRECWLERI